MGVVNRSQVALPEDSRDRAKRLATLSLGALGVVYGDIGTSPLYAFRESFAERAIEPDPANVLGVLSLILWSLIIVISIKYLVFVMRADHDGEGGILALTALVPRSGDYHGKGRRRALVLVGLFGTALLYGDGMITPAISVLSAVEGVSVATDALDPLIIPMAVGILVGLFAFQRRGTGAVSAVFGPVMGVWFATLAILARDEPALLTRHLDHRTWHVARDLAKVLRAIGDPIVAPPLVRLARHDHPEVRREAQNGLIALTPTASATALAQAAPTLRTLAEQKECLDALAASRAVATPALLRELGAGRRHHATIASMQRRKRSRTAVVGGESRRSMRSPVSARKSSTSPEPSPPRRYL